MMFIVRRSELAKPLHAWLFLTVNGSCIYFANLRNFVFDAFIQDFRGLFGGLETGEAGRGLFFYDLGERFISAFASFDAEKDGFYG